MLSVHVGCISAWVSKVTVFHLRGIECREVWRVRGRHDHVSMIELATKDEHELVELSCPKLDITASLAELAECLVGSDVPS